MMWLPQQKTAHFRVPCHKVEGLPRAHEGQQRRSSVQRRRMAKVRTIRLQHRYAPRRRSRLHLLMIIHLRVARKAKAPQHVIHSVGRIGGAAAMMMMMATFYSRSATTVAAVGWVCRRQKEMRRSRAPIEHTSAGHQVELTEQHRGDRCSHID